MRRLVMAFLPALALTSAALPAAARTSCDTYGRCFDFTGPNDRLGGGEADQLWQRIDAAVATQMVTSAVKAGDKSAIEIAATDGSASAEPGAPVDPLALANGTVGDPMELLDSDD